MTRTFSSGMWRRSRSTAASVSRVGTSPQQAMTTSGSWPRSLLAHSQMPRPASQCLIASNDLRLFVDDMIDEPRILMAEAVMVLPPDMARQEIVQRPDRPAPGNLIAHLQPFGVLIEHRIDDVNECFVAGEEAVPAGQQITLEPSLTLVLAQHLHDPAVRSEMVVPRLRFGHPCPVGDFEHVLPAVRIVFVGA